MQENSFLTEFDKISFIKRTIFSLNGYGLALFFFSFALLNVFLSYLSGADCFWLKISDGATETPHLILMGYWGELNAGPLYLFVVPVFVFLACNFLCSLHEAFSGIDKAGTLISSVPEKNSLEALGEKNRKIFKPVVFILISLSLFLIVGLEIISFTNTGQELSKKAPKQAVMGYVQAPYFMAWATSLADTSNPEFLNNQIPWTKGKSNLSIQQKGEVTSKILFWVFLISALLLQTLFVFFSAWIAVKILFYFWVVWKALPKNNDEEIKNFIYFAPNYEDPNRRYGLLELDLIYRQILWLVIFTGIGVVSNLSNNYPKGTAFSQMQVKNSDWLSSLLGQGWLIGLPVGISIVFAFLPLSVFREFMRKTREKVQDKLNNKIRMTKQAISEIETEIEKNKDEEYAVKAKTKKSGKSQARRNELKHRYDDLEKFEKRKELLFSQTTYPKGEKLFTIQCVLVFMLLVVMPLFFATKILFNPKGSPSEWIFETATTAIKVIRAVSELICGCNN